MVDWLRFEFVVIGLVFGRFLSYHAFIIPQRCPLQHKTLTRLIIVNLINVRVVIFIVLLKESPITRETVVTTRIPRILNYPCPKMH